jgi:uncharacterized protein YndB with AHSA1/START domain
VSSVEIVEPIRKQIFVEASQAHAFRVFTDGIDRWWPREHHIGKSPLKRSVLEPGVNGRWYAICEDDSQCDVGKVLAWEPPGRLLLAWQINGDWRYDAAFVTEIEVRFIVEGPKRTRVELEHRNLERYGAAAPAIRKTIDSPGGWAGILASFSRVASTDAE